MSKYDGKTQAVLNWFTEISQIPHQSKKEEKIRAWLIAWAEKRNFEHKEDSAGNVLIKVPGTEGYEKAPIVVLQGHMDMVCEKTPESTINFDTDPLKLVYDGDWLKAEGTTLGADNGIAIAIAFAMVEDTDVAHGPLEILMTVDEETGLTGANALEPGFLDGKILLNIDSEDEGVFTVGCAGGEDIEIEIPLTFKKASGKAYTLKVGNLKGGHSGVDVHEQRGSAIISLMKTIDALSEEIDVQLADIKGGSAHNAIPRDAEAVLILSDLAKAEKIVAAKAVELKKEIAQIDPDMTITLEAGGEAGRVLTEAAFKNAVDFVLGMPHGVASFSMVMEGLVETSNNFATISIDGDNLKVLSSQRSSMVSRLHSQTRKIAAVAKLAGGSCHVGDGYPPWEANWDSALLAKCKTVYKGIFGKDPVVEVIHAGLECGIIGDKNEGMDMISFGPTIKNPHCPDECLFIPDVKKIYDFMTALFKDIK
jgi:dipeptidase D